MELRRKSSSNRLSDSLSKNVPNSKSSPSGPLKKKHPRGTCFSCPLAFKYKSPHPPKWEWSTDILENCTQVLTSVRPGTLKQIGGGWASVNQSVNQSINRSTSQSVSQSFSQSVNEHIHQSVQLSINHSINHASKQSINHDYWTSYRLLALILVIGEDLLI